jgi:hypothetical protein
VSTTLDLSLEQQIALLPLDMQEKVLADLELDALPWEWLGLGGGAVQRRPWHRQDPLGQRVRP